MMAPKREVSQVDSNPDLLKEEGLKHFRTGDREKALSTFELAAEIYAQQENKAGEAEMRNNMGVILRLEGDFPKALEAFNAAQAGFLEAASTERRGQVVGNMGDLYASMHDYDRAAEHYSQSSELLASCGAGDLQGQVLRAFSLMRMRQRRWVEAIDLMALSISVRDHPSLGQRFFYALLQVVRRLLGTR